MEEDLSGKFQNGADLPCREVTGKSSAIADGGLPSGEGQQYCGGLLPVEDIRCPMTASEHDEFTDLLHSSHHQCRCRRTELQDSHCPETRLWL